jgi:hypothetical protein
LSEKSRIDTVKTILKLIGTLNQEEKQQLLDGLSEGIPISAFKAKLSSLEIIIKYLKEEENSPFKEISKILNRKLSTIYNTYNKSKIKFKKNLDISDTLIKIPYNIFANRKYSVLESIVSYLKDKQKLSFKEISYTLNKSYSTIKTVYGRYKIKNG